MAKTTTLLLLNRSTVDQLNLRHSGGDKTSPDCPFSETDRQGGADKSEIGSQEPCAASEILKAKATVGGLDPVGALQSSQD